MIRRNGPQKWKNIHATVELHLEDLIDIDNSTENGVTRDLSGVLNQTSSAINALINEASANKKQIKAIGSGWALSKIQVTDHYLLNTKLLNKVFEVEDSFFHPDYDTNKRKYLIIAQCGISVGELNVYLELPKTPGILPRSLKTAGIGAGQTIVGAVLGNTHGAGINFGAIPDFIVGIQLCNGTNKPIWLERKGYPVLNDTFTEAINSKLIRHDHHFNATLVSFGTFGVITAFAIETEAMYHIAYPPIAEVNQLRLSQILKKDHYSKLRHLEFIFNPYEDDVFHVIEGTQMPYEEGHPIPDPVWIITNKKGYAPGDFIASFLLNFPFVSAKSKCKRMYKEYLKRSVLSNVRGTPGQLFTATITYLEGYNETAFAVGIHDAIKTINIIKQEIRSAKLPLIIQARAVACGNALLGFTNHEPACIVFEFGITNDKNYPIFEERLIQKLLAENIRYTLHWSKNSLINAKRLKEMYGDDLVQRWKASRYTLFENKSDLIKVFDNKPLVIAELDKPALMA